MKKTFYFMALACAVVLASCANKNSLVTKGDKSQLDTLSYVLGSDNGFRMYEGMGEIPFDIVQVTKGVEQGALNKSKLTRDEVNAQLEEYFKKKYQERVDLLRKARSESKKAKQPEPKADTIMFESEQERRDVSYAFGVDMGYNMQEYGQPLQVYWFNEGLLDSYKEEATPRISREDGFKFLRHYFTVVFPERNRKENEAWLAEIEKQPGVQKTESGLLYKIEVKGDETIIATDPRDTVVVDYIGTNHKDEPFDSSYFEFKPEDVKEWILKRDPESAKVDKPLPIALNRVIKGWTEGLMLVGKGGVITLWIPSDLAYGERAASRQIPANEALKFKIEVRDVIPYVEKSDTTLESKIAKLPEADMVDAR